MRSPRGAAETAQADSQAALRRGGSPGGEQTAQFGAAVARSEVMRSLFERLARAASTDETILLSGESGTGKEVLAEAIHAESPRRDGPFVVLDCGAQVPGLLDAELFGHTRGAFTGAHCERPGLMEQAHGGTLFIDELGELPLDLQPKLLRAIESRRVRRVGATTYRRVDVRIVAATHRDLRSRIIEGAFREDLYYRLAVIEGHVPPLRERPEDIRILVDRFLATRAPPRSAADLPEGTIALLEAHSWPGNVRELRNTIARLSVLPELGRAAIGPRVCTTQDAELKAVLGLSLRDARDAIIRRFERGYVTAKLAQTGGVVKAAAAMGVSRQFLHRLMVRHGLEVDQRD